MAESRNKPRVSTEETGAKCQSRQVNQSHNPGEELRISTRDRSGKGTGAGTKQEQEGNKGKHSCRLDTEARELLGSKASQAALPDQSDGAVNQVAC